MFQSSPDLALSMYCRTEPGKPWYPVRRHTRTLKTQLSLRTLGHTLNCANLASVDELNVVEPLTFGAFVQGYDVEEKEKKIVTSTHDELESIAHSHY